MKIGEKAKKLADYIYNFCDINDGVIGFDMLSYDIDEDIPHIYINGERKDVEEVKISKRGRTLEIVFADYDNVACIGTYVHLYNKDENDASDMLEHTLIDMGIDELLYNMFYETSESYNFMDFEDLLENGYEDKVEPKTFGVTCTLVMNGYKEVIARNENEAVSKVKDLFNCNNHDDSVCVKDGYYGDVRFNFGEVTADFAEEV